MATQAFIQTFGEALPGTAVAASALGLHDSVLRFSPGPQGVFRNGLLSICSTRENGGDLGAWGPYLPPGTRLFASSAFGFLFALAGEALWVIDPHYGQVVESDVSLSNLWSVLSESALRRDHLREPLFAQWQALNPQPLTTDWLCPTPAIALAGHWTVSTLKPMPPALLLSFTAQLFDASGSSAVEVRLLGP